MNEEDAKLARSEYETEEEVVIDEVEIARRKALIWVFEDDVEE